MNEKTSYIVGATVNLLVIVSPADSNTPVDASSVVLDALYSGATNATVHTAVFSHTATGTYTYALDTTGLAPGVWTWRAKATTTEGISYQEDVFVLRPRTGGVTVSP